MVAVENMQFGVGRIALIGARAGGGEEIVAVAHMIRTGTGIARSALARPDSAARSCRNRTTCRCALE